jgi:hypothetical protein
VLLHAFWWVVLIWLGLCLGGEIYYGLAWLRNPEALYANEALMGVTLAVFFSWPGLLGAWLLASRFPLPSARLHRGASKGIILAGLAIGAALWAARSLR